MIDTTKLLTFGSIGLALIFLGAFLSWQFTSNTYEKDIAQLKQEFTQERKNLTDQANKELLAEVERGNALDKQLTQLGQKSSEDLANEKQKAKALADAVNSGTRKLRITSANLATCQLTKGSQESTGSMGNAASIELSREGGRIVSDIRVGIIEDRAKIKYLQEYIKSN